MKDPRYCLKAVNSTTQDILNELDSTYKAPVCIMCPYVLLVR